MGFKCGLVGLPNAGKSTVFNALTRMGVEASAYPFCTIDPHFGIVPLQDARLDTVFEAVGSKKKTPTVLEFVDIAGLVKGAHQGEGMGNQFLSHISRTDAIAHVVRCFEDPNVAHSYEALDPVRDAEIVSLELILKDLEFVEKRLARTKNAARSGDRRLKSESEALQIMEAHLNQGESLLMLEKSGTIDGLIREMNLFSAKPVMFIANCDENRRDENPLLGALQEYASRNSAPCIPFCGKIQAEISELDDEDQLAFLQDMGLGETGFQKILRAGYELLNLISFFTANDNEAHSWTVERGTPAVRAAGVVHSDFENGFIKAEVIKVADLENQGSIRRLHELGLAEIHGREYEVEDGDLLFFHTR
jgi:GTP-binding protein YchF